MSIQQTIEVPATPVQIYTLLTTASLFEQMTGGRKAKISAEAGGEVSLFDGEIRARNVELVPGKRVVQAWRARSWPEGVYSIVRFECDATAEGSRLTFSQSGHPAEAEAMLESGWSKMYWEPMQAMFAG